MNNTTRACLFFILLLTGTVMRAQEFHLPVSTKSEAAREAYRTASDLGSNVHFAASREAIDRALAADPDFFMAYAYLIQVLASDDEKPALLERALAIEPSKFNEAERIFRGYLLALREDSDALPTTAMKALVKAFPRNPGAHQWAYLHAAYTEKDVEAAIRYAHRLAELAPDYGPVHNTLGYLYMGRGEMDKAKEHLSKYISLSPDESNAYDSMGEYYATNGDYQRSATYYTKAAARGMENAEERALAALAKLQSPSAEDVQHVEKVWDQIVNQGKIDQINPTNFAPDILRIDGSDTVAGLDAFKAYYQHYLTGFSDISFTVQDMFGQGDKLVKHWRFRGKHTGVFFDIPPTGNTVDVEGVTLITMKDGKIAREQDFMDNMAFTQQLGLLPDFAAVKVIDGIYEAFSAGDMPTVLSLLDPKIVWREAEGNDLADGNPYVGPDAVLEGVFARLAAQHESFELKDIELHPMADNQVLATLRYDARRKESGRKIDAQAAHLWTVKDGKVTAFQQYTDTRQLAEAAKK